MATLSHMFLVIVFALKEGGGIDKIAFFIVVCYSGILQMESIEYL